MLDLNAKLSTFRKMVWDEEKAKSEKELYNSTHVNSSQIDEKKENLEKDLKKTLESRRSFAQIRGNEKISKLEEEQKTNFYSHKEYLLNDMVSEIKNKLKEYTKTEDYKKSLKENIEKALKNLDEDPSDFTILVKEADKDLLSYPNLGIMDDKYIGGFILKANDGSYQYNRTYLARIEDNKYEIGRTLYKLFERESFNESKN